MEHCLGFFKMLSRAFCLCATVVPLALASAGHAAADTYALDPQHTEVRFTWDHLGLSRQGGRFTTAEGAVVFDPTKPDTSTVDVKIPVKSISTGVKKLDEHLITTKDFFDVAAFPAITFKSTVVRMKSDKTGELEGDLSINGITKPVVLDVIWNFSGEHPLQTINPVYAGAYASGFSATTQIRRSDWGITRTIPYISDELRITIETEMIRTAESPVAEGASGSGGLPPLPDAPGSDGSRPAVSGSDATAPDTAPDMEKTPDAGK
jgi:polyisoprenoid-binding protein YceI